MLNNDRVTIIAVGVVDYKHMQPLKGPIKDVEKLRNMLTENSDTAPYKKERFIELIDPDSAQLRKAIIDYAMGRSAKNDILLFYFSGHGLPIGNFDLGFCTTDTQVHPTFKIPIPLNLVRFRDIVETLAAVQVDPVFIIDACFSGQAGEMINIVYSELKRTIQADTGSSYALLCSSAKNEETPDHYSGGQFSELLISVAKKGIGAAQMRKSELSLNDLYPKLKEEVERTIEIGTKLFIGDTLPDFGFVRNTQYKPRTESLGPHKNTLLTLWNNGSPKVFSINELQKKGSTIHTTYSKLDYKPGWGLLDKVGSNKRGKQIQLNPLGCAFMRNEIELPYNIQKCPNSEEWKAAPRTRMVKFKDI